MPRTLSFLSLFLFAQALTAASWTSGGPLGGAIQAVASPVSNPRIVYASGYRGVFRSDDNGETWRDVGHGVGSIARLTVDPHDPDTVYGIAGGGLGPVYRTVNGGATWTAVDLGLYRPNTVVIDPADSNNVYASGDCGYLSKVTTRQAGVVKSTDRGVTWRDATDGFGRNIYAECVASLALDPANPAHLFLFSVEDAESGYWESLDGARSWTLSSGPVPSREVIADPRPEMAMMRYGTDGRRWLTSADGGLQWSEQSPIGLPVRITASLADLAVDPSVPRLFRTTAAGLYRSGDGGQSWVPTGDMPAIEVNAVLFNPADATVMIATSEGVFRAPSPRFTPWKQLAMPESGITSIMQIAADPRKPSVVYASTQDGNIPGGRVFRSRDNGANWELLVGPNMPRARLAVSGNGDLWFAADFTSTLYRLRDGASDIELVGDFGRMQGIAAPPDAPERVYVAGDTLSRTDDAGRSWQPCSVGGPFRDLASVHADTVYVGSASGLLKSTDACATFRVLPTGVGTVWLVAPAPSDSSIVYAYMLQASELTLWRSDDGGETWNRAAPPFTSRITKIAVDPFNARSVWVSSDHGVWHSADAGASWSDLTAGLPNSSVTSLAIDATGTLLHAGVLGAGVWELPVGGRPRVRSVRPGR